MKKTSNLNLSLYEPTDKFTITAPEDSFNHNMELIDASISNRVSQQDMEEYVDAHLKVLGASSNRYYETYMKTEEEVDGVTINFPVELSKFIELHVHFKFPNVETAFQIYSRCGKTNYKGYGQVPVSSSSSGASGAHFTFYLGYGDVSFISYQMASWPENARPVNPSSVLGNQYSEITYYSATSGVLFPANTEVWIKGVYTE